MCSQVMKMYLVLKFDFNFWNKKDLSLKASQRSIVAFVRLEHSVYTTRLCLGAHSWLPRHFEVGTRLQEEISNREALKRTAEHRSVNATH